MSSVTGKNFKDISKNFPVNKHCKDLVEKFENHQPSQPLMITGRTLPVV